MKKIFLFLASVLAFAACDPEQEDFSMGSNISESELLSYVTVETDKGPSGLNGNVISCKCSTSAPVSLGWQIDDKFFPGHIVSKKVKLGDHKVTLTALCGDGTKIIKEFTVKVDEITDSLTKYYLYGDPAKGQKPFVLGSGDAGAGRFSDNEGKYLPYISNDVYHGKKTLIFDIIAAEDGPFIWGGDDAPVEKPTMRIMNGWWATTYADDVPMSVGLWELTLTDEIAKECAKDGDSKDLDLLMTRGSITIKAVYYEE